jgi:endonuclease III
MTKRKNESIPASAAKKPVRKSTFRCPYSLAEVAEIFRRFSVQRPSPTTELHYTNPYTLLVAVALSAQMTDSGVNKATQPLFAEVDTPQKMLDLGEERLREAIKTINFNNNKAKNVIVMARQLVNEFGGEVPKTREKLESLAGVGRKTANVMLATVFGVPSLAVDTHIFRIGNRLKIAPGKTPDEVEAHFLEIIPENYLGHAHHWLILHGRYTCKARRPECEHCIIADLCKSPEKTCDVPAALFELPPQVI